MGEEENESYPFDRDEEVTPEMLWSLIHEQAALIHEQNDEIARLRAGRPLFTWPRARGHNTT